MKKDNEIKAKIIEILRKYSSVSNTEIIDEQISLILDLQVNSARIVDVMLDIEEAFDIIVPDENYESTNTVGDLINIVKSIE